MLKHVIDGQLADPDRLGRLATFNYGHFTSMQVRGGGVRGLDLHLARLYGASRELFGEGLNPGRVVREVRAALDGAPDAAVRVSVFPGEAGADPIILVSVGPPEEDTGPPLRVRTRVHLRYLPHLKHVATLPLLDQRRRARLDGFDDVLFVDGGGDVLEGSIWNLGAFDGDRVIWPEGPKLEGVTLQLVRQGLASLGVPQTTRRLPAAELNPAMSAFTTYSLGAGRLIGSVDGTPLKMDEPVARLVAEAYARHPFQPL